uniref:S1/P1 nuclease n=1 Tax=Alistipes sp. TaxID=1872444 RepID=UPI004057C193
MKKLSTLIAVLIAFAGVERAQAWNGIAHGSIVYIAEQHLTPEAKEKCRYYLRHTLAYYASWMDYWRTMEQFKKVNNPHSVMATPDGKGLLITKGGSPKGRVMGHLRLALAELGDGKYKSLPDSVVRQRLINMVHYLPDMHCPSHVRFARPKKNFPQYQYEIVSNNGKQAGYHGFWDSSLSRGRKGWTNEDYYKRLDKVSKRQAKAWQSGSLTDWGRDIVKGGHQGRALCPKSTDIAKMTKKQKKEVTKLADEMALQAAYRLAHVLNTIFSDGNIPVK